MKRLQCNFHLIVPQNIDRMDDVVYMGRYKLPHKSEENSKQQLVEHTIIKTMVTRLQMTRSSLFNPFI